MYIAQKFYSRSFSTEEYFVRFALGDYSIEYTYTQLLISILHSHIAQEMQLFTIYQIVISQTHIHYSRRTS